MYWTVTEYLWFLATIQITGIHGGSKLADIVHRGQSKVRYDVVGIQCNYTPHALLYTSSNGHNYYSYGLCHKVYMYRSVMLWMILYLLLSSVISFHLKYININRKLCELMDKPFICNVVNYMKFSNLYLLYLLHNFHILFVCCTCFYVYFIFFLCLVSYDWTSFNMREERIIIIKYYTKLQYYFQHLNVNFWERTFFTSTRVKRLTRFM